MSNNVSVEEQMKAWAMKNNRALTTTETEEAIIVENPEIIAAAEPIDVEFSDVTPFTNDGNENEDDSEDEDLEDEDDNEDDENEDDEDDEDDDDDDDEKPVAEGKKIRWASLFPTAEPNTFIEVDENEFDNTVEFVVAHAVDHGVDIMDNYSEFQIYEAFLLIDNMAEQGLIDESCMDDGKLDLSSEDFWKEFCRIIDQTDATKIVNPETVIPVNSLPATDPASDRREVVNKLSELTDVLRAQREEHTINEITKLLTSISKVQITGIGDVTVLAAENTLLRSHLMTLLANLDVKVEFSHVQQVRGHAISERRRVNYLTHKRLPLKELAAGVTVGISEIAKIKENLSKLSEADTKIKFLTTQLESSTTLIAAHEAAINNAEIEARKMRRDVGVDSADHPGVVVRFIVKVKTKAGLVDKLFYLTAEQNDEGKVRVKDYKRTREISEAIHFPDKDSAKEAVDRILKYTKNINPESGLKDTYLQNAIYVRRMEKIV